jgi:hypothetical protein
MSTTEPAATGTAVIPTTADVLAELMAIPAKSDSFLDDLLAGAMKVKEENRRIEQNKKLLRAGNLNQKEREETEAAIARWEAERLWTPKADVAIFHQQQCLTCGTTQELFVGIFQRQANRQLRVNRWVRVPAHQNAGLFKEVKYEVSHERTCHVCAQLNGYPVAQARRDMELKHNPLGGL